MDYIAGFKGEVDMDLRQRGFERVGESVWQKGERRIRWVWGAEQIRGVDGGGRNFIVRAGAENGISREAVLRRFTVAHEIE